MREASSCGGRDAGQGWGHGDTGQVLSLTCHHSHPSLQPERVSRIVTKQSHQNSSLMVSLCNANNLAHRVNYSYILLKICKSRYGHPLILGCPCEGECEWGLACVNTSARPILTLETDPDTQTEASRADNVIMLRQSESICGPSILLTNQRPV